MTPAAGGAEEVRVMLVDDSATIRAALSRLLAAEPGIRVVHAAADGRAALAALAQVEPDVVLLDLEMPVMDGMTALPLILKVAPQAAVIVASALTQRGAKAAIAALAAGAADYVPKPQGAAGGAADPAFRTELIAKLRGWARKKRLDRVGAPARAPAAPPPSPRSLPPARWRPALVAIGSSTGGPQALAELVARLPPLAVPVVVVQHMPAGFTAMLAEHLDRLGPLRCAEAREGEPLSPGRIFLAPGERHLLLQAVAEGAPRLRLTTDPPENFCRPAVDPMLRSAVAACGGRVLAVILTGMGQDGLAGCRAVVQAGGQVLAQDEASAVVWGMPGAVARAGLATLLAPPAQLAERIAALAAERVPA